MANLKSFIIILTHWNKDKSILTLFAIQRKSLLHGLIKIKIGNQHRLTYYFNLFHFHYNSITGNIWGDELTLNDSLYHVETENTYNNFRHSLKRKMAMPIDINISSLADNIIIMILNVIWSVFCLAYLVYYLDTFVHSASWATSSWAPDKRSLVSDETEFKVKAVQWN